MARTMPLTSRDEYFETMRCRYGRSTGKLAKGTLLEEFGFVTGHERKYAGNLLSKLRSPGCKALPHRIGAVVACP